VTPSHLFRKRIVSLIISPKWRNRELIAGDRWKSRRLINVSVRFRMRQLEGI
jgi:hypothetical protein